MNFDHGPLVFRIVFRLGTGIMHLDPSKAPVWAPTLNEYNGLKPWRKHKLRAAHDALILQTKAAFPDWAMGITEKLVLRKPRKRPIGTMAMVKSKSKRKATNSPYTTVRSGGRRRIVSVTRYSSREPDEPTSPDSIGGKVPIDRLVRAMILRDDNRKWVERHGQWIKCAPRSGRVVVEVYEMPRA
jgi:hypothetical protein